MTAYSLYEAVDQNSAFIPELKGAVSQESP